MPLNPNDTYYRRESTPISITALGVGLRSAFGAAPGSFGSKGNLVHTSGYHRSRAWVLNSPDSRYGSRDYSVQQSLDRGGDDDWICAFDFTPAEWGTERNRELMVLITKRVRAAARARDPRLANLREFAGTEDGIHVVTFNCSDGSAKTPFDSSHLDHGHGSFWRSRASNSHAGILEVMTGEDMPSLDATDITNIWKVEVPEQDWDEVPADWNAQEPGAALGQGGQSGPRIALGGLHRRNYLQLRGLLAIDSKLNQLLGERPDPNDPDTGGVNPYPGVSPDLANALVALGWTPPAAS